MTKGGFEMTIDCWITEVAEEINDEEVNPDSKLYSKVSFFIPVVSYKLSGPGSVQDALTLKYV